MPLISRIILSAAILPCLVFGSVGCHSTPSTPEKPRVVIESDPAYNIDLIEKTPDRLVVEVPWHSSFDERAEAQRFASKIAARDGNTATCIKFDEPNHWATSGVIFGVKPKITATYQLTKQDAGVPTPAPAPSAPGFLSK